MDLGKLEQVAGRWQLTFVRRLRHPREKVWQALTQAEQVKAWFPSTIEGGWAPGATLRFAFEGGFKAEGRLLQFKPPSVMEFTWGQNETLRFVLEQDGEGCVLTFVNRFDELGKAARDAAGWHSCLDVLELSLDGVSPPWASKERWQKVHPLYVEALGPAATTIGPPV
jgi:uncharacterized protein YndB with AHSA1/START domain